MSILMGDFHHSRKFKYIYIATRKVACSSIKQMLQTAELGSTETTNPENSVSANRFGYSQYLLNIHDATKWTLVHPNNYDDIERLYENSRLSFCFVRNPYTRILSAFLDKILENEYRRELFLGSSRLNQITLRNFLEFIAAQDPDQMDGHWRPQLHHLTSFNIKYSLTGCFERFETDLVTIISSVSPSILNFRRDVREHSTSAATKISLIDQPCIELIQKIYREDFEGLGYSVDISDCLKPPFYSSTDLASRICL